MGLFQVSFKVSAIGESAKTANDVRFSNENLFTALSSRSRPVRTCTVMSFVEGSDRDLFNVRRWEDLLLAKEMHSVAAAVAKQQ